MDTQVETVVEEWGLTIGTQRQAEYDALSESVIGLTAGDTCNLCAGVNAEGKIEILKGEGKGLAASFRQGPVKAVGLYQVNVVDYFNKSAQKVGKALKKFIESRKADYPQFFEMHGTVKKFRKVQEIALEVVFQHETVDDIEHLGALVDLAQDYMECVALKEAGTAAQAQIVDDVDAYRKCNNLTFHIDGASYTPASWYQVQTMDRAEINRLAAK